MKILDRPVAAFWLSVLFFWAASYAIANMIVYHLLNVPLTILFLLPVLLLNTVIDLQALALAGAALVGPILYVIWSFPLSKGQVKIHAMSKVLAVVLFALSILWLILNWTYGVRPRGLPFLMGYCTVNLFIAAGLTMAERSNKTKPAFGSNLIFHWLLFMWTAWVAFPILEPF